MISGVHLERKKVVVSGYVRCYCILSLHEANGYVLINVLVEECVGFF